jgi:hypothetical protein
MSQLLVSELTALSSETKRKNPEVKAASEVALTALRYDEGALLKSSRENTQPEEDVLLKPIILACSAKATSAKVISLAVGLLQRIIGIKAVREDESHLSTIVNILTNVVTSRADVDVQLKVLQVVSSLLSSYHSIHNQLLSDTLHLCFRLQDSRIAVVSSTAAATLRQAVMIIFEKVREEDTKRKEADTSLESTPVDIPGTEGVVLYPSSKDAYSIITDLNSLANSEHAPYLSLESLSRTFTLELIESILTNHAHLFRSDAHPELLFCLRQSTCPLLIKAFNEQASFPTTLRLMRLLFVLLRQFSSELIVEVEILMSILIKCIACPSRKTSGTANGRSSIENAPPWQRVLAMEATRSLCADGVLLRNLWKWFDGKPNSARVFTNLVDTLHQLATESPSITGKAEAEHQMSDAPVANGTARRPSAGDRGYSSLYGAAAGMANAAISGFSNLAESGAGLSQTSVPGVQLIDQLDKSEAPSPPISYIYLLALQSLVHLAQSLAAYALPSYSRYVNSRPKSAPRAPPALDIMSLNEEEKLEITAVKDMLQQCWAPLLNSFTFFLASKCDDVLFAEVLIALRNFTNATGVLGLDSPRDALVATLARFAVPRSVIVKLVNLRGKSVSGAQEELDCTLSERNAACLKSVTQIAYYLSGSLGRHWRDVLETLCDAEFVLRKGGSRRRSRSKSTAADEAHQSDGASYQPRASMASISALSTVPPGFYSASAMDSATGRPMALTNIDADTLLAEIARVFENTLALGDDAFVLFVEAMCELDSDSVGLVEGSSNSASTTVNRSFPLSSLATVAKLNVQRLTTLDKSMGWDLYVKHLLMVYSSSLRPSLRLQAAEALDVFLTSAMRVTSDDIASVQQRSLQAVTEQSILSGKRQVAADIDVRRLGLETLVDILEKHGHSLLLGWELIFELCAAACAPSEAVDDASVRSTVSLIKTAFTSLQLVCSDLLTKLDLKQLEGCVKTLTLFSKQKEDVNVALTANGTLWAVTAEISARAERDSSKADTEQITALWIYVLKSVLELTSDERLEVRNGAISILFNILEQYGSSLSRSVWTSNVMDEVLFPLLDNMAVKCNGTISTPAESEADDRAAMMGQAASRAKQWEESRVLALSSTGKVIRLSFIDKVMHDKAVFKTLFRSLQQAYLQGPSSTSQAAIRALHNILQVELPAERQEVLEIWKMAWQTWSAIGGEVNSCKAIFTQANLLAYVNALEPIYQLLGKDLKEEELQVLLSCLKTALTYSKANERVSDADRMTPLQSAVINVLSTLHITPHIASMILYDVAEYTTLAFSSSQHATYLALNRATTVAMLDYYSKWSQEVQIYKGGAVQHMFAALLLPLKLRYDCPRGREENPIWKGSLITFCKSAALCCARLDELELEKDVISDIWIRLQSVLSAALTADCSAMMELSLSKQEEEQVFDLTLLSTIECDIWPYLGREHVPQDCIIELAKAMSVSSRLFTVDEAAAAGQEQHNGNLQAHLEAAPRELFAYWSFDLLILMSQKAIVTEEKERDYKRVACLFLPFLMQRISSSISQYTSESRLRGTRPASRLQDEEINYILDQLQKIDLWQYSLLVAKGKLTIEDYLQAEAQKESSDVAWLTMQSSKGLLYHVYPLLCDFLLYVTPLAGSTTLSNEATCGTSILMEREVELPAGFQMGKIGKTRDNSGKLEDARRLARLLLEEVGSVWK